MTNRTQASLTRIALLLAAFVLAPGASAQTTWYVGWTGSCDTGIGTPGSSTNPFCSIQDAVIASTHGDTVLIAAGAFAAGIDLMGKEITLRGAGEDYTTLNGNALDDAGIICSSGETSLTIIEDLAVSFCDGRLEASGRRLGGGMYIKDSSPTVRNVKFSLNHLNEDVLASGAGGGGIYLYNSNSLIENCTFNENSAGPWDLGAYSGNGGGIYNEASTTSVIGCVFFQNWVDWGKGGAIYNGAGSDVYVEGCTFISNVARAEGSTAFIGGGAGIYNEDSTCEIVGSAFTWNLTAEANGGASVTNFNSSMEMRNCTIATNRVPLGATGRAILNVNSSRDITNTILYDSSFALYDGSPLIGDMGTTTGLVTYSYIYGGYSGTGFGAGIIELGIDFEDLYGHDMVWGSLDDNFRIRPLSTTVDAGNSNSPALPAGYDTDFYGRERVLDACVDDTGLGFPCVDMGVHEVRGGDIIVPDDFPTIQGAINEWNDTEYCGGIMVRGGLYNERINLQGKAVTLRAEFLVTDPSTSDFPVINGEDLGIVVTFNSEETRDTVLEGFMIIGGLAVDGAGMFILRSSPTIRDCYFDANTATSSSGAVFVWDEFGTGVADPLFENCTFTNNTAGEIGVSNGTGGVARIIASATFTDCTFINNQAVGVTSADGSAGAVDIPLNSIVNFERCSFSGNSAGGGGGALTYGGGYLLTISHCLFEENSSGVGGAIRFSYTPAVIEHTRFVGNTATGDGGAVHLYNSSITLEECEFSSNSATSNGGAIYLQASSTSIDNCSLSNNVSGADGGAVYLLSGSVPITNSIVWGNSTPQLAWDPSHPNITANYSDIEGGIAGDGNIDEDPHFVDAANDDLHLLSWSPCIDAADNTAMHNSITDPTGAPYLDLDGLPRFVDAPYTADTGVQTGDGTTEIADMGPYELQVQDCPADLNNDGYLDTGDITSFVDFFLAADLAVDLNNDGFIDNGDITAFVEHFLGGC